jgi:hypothetical protein
LSADFTQRKIHYEEIHDHCGGYGSRMFIGGVCISSCLGPEVIISLIVANKNSLKGRLLLTGTLGYFLYTYTSYSFLSMYNSFFLIYVSIMSLSFFAFIINITSNELKLL